MKNFNLISGILIAAVIIVTFGFTSVTKAETSGDKTVSGKVALVASNMIMVEYERTGTSATEIMIPFDGGTQFTRLNDSKDIQVGDIVTVTYTETVMADKGGKKKKPRRVAADIELMSRATSALVSP